MQLNGAGRLARAAWEGLPRRFPGVGLDTFVVMPNHVHGIIVIDESVGASLVGAQDGDHAGMADGERAAARVVGAERATTRVAPTGCGNDAGERAERERATTRVAPTLGDVVGAYKSIVTVEYARGVRANGWRRFRGRLWQRNYYEHVIRDERELHLAREYIVNNPLQWSLDRENPDAHR